MRDQPRTGLERSCSESGHDWIARGPWQPGLERIEAFFSAHAYDPHRHDTYAVGYTLGGVQRFHYRGIATASTPGKVLVIHPDERHDGWAGTEVGFHYRMLYVEPCLIRAALGGRAKSLPFVRSVVSTSPRLLGALRPAFDDLSRTLEGLQSDQVVLGVAEALLAMDPSAQGSSPASACAIAVERARQFLDANHHRIVASEELEKTTGLDRYTLARHFRVRLGTSPYRYLTMRRLEYARSLLAVGETLVEAAASSGFADQSHMTRQFKRAYGISPGRWQSIQNGVS